jgi:hypothetical protein
MIHGSPRPWPFLTARALLAVAAGALVLAAAGCSGGGTSGAGKTSTAAAVAAEATATQAAIDGPPPTAADIAGFINAGWDGLEIEYGVVNIPSFDNRDVLLGVLNDCDKGIAEGLTPESADYWPVVLGQCYTVGNALGWLYNYTARKDFFYGNLLMRRFNRQKYEQAVAGGATVREEYWTSVTGKIYSLTPISTPIAVTPVP